MNLPENPITRVEKFLNAIAGGENTPPEAISRIERYLAAILENIGSGDIAISAKPNNKLTKEDDGLYVAPIAASIPSSMVTVPFSNATFSGTVYALGVEVSEDIKIVSFWGNATLNAQGTSGNAFVIMSPTDYPMLSRFVGKVDQWGMGIDASDWQTIWSIPIRITANAGLELVTPPGNIALNTDFTWQFVLILDESVN